MVERIEQLLKKRGISAYKMTSDLGLSNSAVTDWKKGKAKPSTDAIFKMANYFNVTTDYLLTGKEPHMWTMTRAFQVVKKGLLACFNDGANDALYWNEEAEKYVWYDDPLHHYLAKTHIQEERFNEFLFIINSNPTEKENFVSLSSIYPTLDEIMQICAPKQHVYADNPAIMEHPDVIELINFLNADFFSVTPDYLLTGEELHTQSITDILKDIKTDEDDHDWTQEELDKLAEFASFIKAQRKQQA